MYASKPRKGGAYDKLLTHLAERCGELRAGLDAEPLRALAHP